MTPEERIKIKNAIVAVAEAIAKQPLPPLPKKEPSMSDHAHLLPPDPLPSRDQLNNPMRFYTDPDGTIVLDGTGCVILTRNHTCLYVSLHKTSTLNYRLENWHIEGFPAAHGGFWSRLRLVGKLIHWLFRPTMDAALGPLREQYTETTTTP